CDVADASASTRLRPLRADLVEHTFTAAKRS
ncbi:MAG: hypothetical protein QOJ35_838, partial [Solirubrobacteraceae bacterium]|nr:hypothetical protein [Solirubrobacteraceae bacterium]